VLILQQRTQTLDGTAIVRYQGQEILHISLEDGSAVVLNDDYVLDIDQTNFTYTVQGNLGKVVIHYNDHKVSVIDETSPQNICQNQGETNTPLRPLTCLPNDVVITIDSQVFDPEDDDAIIQ
ncbi:NusG domain II-containing protein, partial [Methanocalculus natronophilus]|uniref:NusG domain II-containing protein n=1 Tax=Methanocalculus natronophilus TaxID=1262400 RepID=UPI0031B59AD8